MIEYTINGRAAIVRLNHPPLNMLTFELLDALTAAITRANGDDAVSGIILIGDTENFTSGADINIFRSITSGNEAIMTSCRFQAACAHVEQSKKKVVAAIAGSVMGGALELAIAAHRRICTSSTRCCMPEVNLGIIPGAGGTQRLPRLIGTRAALDFMLSGRPIDALDAFAKGLVDAVCEPGILLNEALKLLESTDVPRPVSSQSSKIADMNETTAIISEYRKKAAAGRPEIIAPSMIINAVERGILGSFTGGLAAEQHGFAQCMNTFATRNKLHLFFASRMTTKIPELDAIDPVPVTSTAVIGLGSMGSGIAQAFAASGKKVILLDTDTATAQKGLDRIVESLERKVQRGAANRKDIETILGRLSIAHDWTDIASANLVIEAVFEEIALKQSLIEKAANHCSPHAIIASNTSTISLDDLALHLPHPERLIGLHFFNPAQSMPLVEVIRRKETAAPVVASAVQFIKDLRKTPVLVNNSVGFVVNRIFIPYFIEAFKLYEEGATPEAIDAAMVAFGFPMGPLTLIDMTGIDILYFTGQQMHDTYPQHLSVHGIVESLVKNGMLGQKSGSGVYHYEFNDRTPRFNNAADAIIASVRVASNTTPREFNRDEITERLILRMVNEGFKVIEENICLRESDIDVAMVLGTGFPDFRGGIIKYAYDYGIGTTISRLKTLAASCGRRYTPCNYLLSINKELDNGRRN